MNILVITPWYPSQAHSFEGIYIRQQVRALVNGGYQAVVVSPRPHWLPIPGKKRDYWRRNVGLPSHLIDDDVHVYFPRYWSFPRGIGWRSAGMRCYSAMRGLLRGLAERHQFGIIHGHEFAPVGLCGQYLKRDLKLPIVLTIHGVDPMARTGFAGEKGRCLIDRIRAAIDHVVAVGSPLMPYLERIGFEPRCLSVIPNGVDPEEVVLEAPEDYYQKFGKYRVILSVSNLLRSKGIHVNLMGVKALVGEGWTDLHYVVIGDGPYKGELKRLARELQLENYVTFLGSMTHAETMQYMGACDLFSMPSWKEAFGIVYLEAMANGKPVVGCRGQGAEDVIRDGVDGFLVEPGSVESLVGALRKILQDPGLARRLGEAGRRRAMEFTWGKNTARYRLLFERIVSSGHGLHGNVAV